MEQKSMSHLKEEFNTVLHDNSALSWGLLYNQQNYLQHKLNPNLFDILEIPTITPERRVLLRQYIADMMIAAVLECAEVLEEIDWKPWKTELKKCDLITEDKAFEILMELVDIHHFVMNVLIAYSIPYRAFHAAFQVKQDENVRRFRGESIHSDEYV